MCSPSWTPLPPPSPSHPSGSSQCTSPEHLSHASNLGWRFVSPLIVYLFQWYSLKTSHPRLHPQSPKVCYVHLCLFFCFAYICSFFKEISRSSFLFFWLCYLFSLFLLLSFMSCFIFWKLSPCQLHHLQIYSPRLNFVFSFYLWFSLLWKSFQIWLGLIYLVLLLFVLPWETDIVNICWFMSECVAYVLF